MQRFLFSLIIVSGLSVGGCTKPAVSVEANRTQVAAGQPVEISWSTRDLGTTTLSANPGLSGLPKTLPGDSSGTDVFTIRQTTTFEVEGVTGTGPTTRRTDSVTVSVVTSPIQ